MALKIVKFFDKLEDKTRGFLSKRPILYAIITSLGIILVWRGVWHTADQYAFFTGPVSLVIGTLILLLTGVFVSSFIGNRILLTGIKGEKKLTEMTKHEIDEVLAQENSEDTEMKEIKNTLQHIEEELKGLKKDK